MELRIMGPDRLLLARVFRVRMLVRRIREEDRGLQRGLRDRRGECRRGVRRGLVGGCKCPSKGGGEIEWEEEVRESGWW